METWLDDLITGTEIEIMGYVVQITDWERTGGGGVYVLQE